MVIVGLPRAEKVANQIRTRFRWLSDD